MGDRAREGSTPSSPTMKIGDIDPSDRRFWPEEPEPGFSPERNKAVIDGTIQKYNRKQLEKRRSAFDGIAERAHAVSHFLTSQHGAKVGKSVVDYFGKRELAKLRGEEILETVRNRLNLITNPFTARELGNRIITKKGIHEVYGSQVKKGNKRSSKKTIVV